MNIKERYTHKYKKEDKEYSLYLNKRLFNTYNRIITKLENKTLNKKGIINIDLGSGNCGFSRYCETLGIESISYDYPIFDLEKDSLPHEDSSVDFVTLNAVIEHIANPSNILAEAQRVLKNDGFIFIRTPNFQLDFKNFYNDPTHIKPYTPKSLNTTLKLANFKVIFLEPGLIEKSWLYWNLPNKIKYRVCSMIFGGTKSILAVGRKIKR